MSSPTRSKFEQKIGMGWLSPQESDALAILDPTGQGQEPAADENVALLPGLIRFFNEGPGHLLTIHKTLEAISKRLDSVAGPFSWANCADVQNGAVTAIGSAAYSNGFVGYTKSQSAVLRNILIGSSAANTVQVIAVRNGGDGSGQSSLVPAMLAAAMPLTTVRTTATALSVWAPGEFIVQQGYNVYLYIAAGGSPTVDFSCDYRYLPDM